MGENLSKLQKEVWRILNEKRDEIEGLFKAKIFKISNQEIHSRIKGKKPSDVDYIGTILKALEAKKLLKLEYDYEAGKSGLQRVITIL
ncbi:MAG: hypothetical protein EBS06_05330 [Proteobacteria bacterium]|nr:hypothetical protein [Pseudomonadota bacterium]